MNFQLTKLVVSEQTPEPPPAEGEGEAAEGEEGEGKLNLDAVVAILTQMLHHSSVHTKVAALDWILHLYNKLPSEASLELFQLSHYLYMGLQFESISDFTCIHHLHCKILILPKNILIL